jgi:hypothetical protein
MILGREPALELGGGPHDGVDLAPQIFLNPAEPSQGLPQTDGADDQEVDVASSPRSSGRHRSEHERGLDSAVSEGATQDIDQARGLHQNLAQRSK